MQSALYLATVLCKNIEPPLISLYFGGKIENWYSSLLKHVETCMEIKYIYITKTAFFYSYKHKKSIFDTTFTFQNFKVINLFYFLFSPNHERASCFTH